MALPARLASYSALIDLLVEELVRADNAPITEAPPDRAAPVPSAGEQDPTEPGVKR